jgi:hypothetical protein
MAGFWDAVDRAALGKPAEVMPRPRAHFEPDALGAGEGIDVIEEEIEAPAARDEPRRDGYVQHPSQPAVDGATQGAEVRATAIPEDVPLRSDPARAPEVDTHVTKDANPQMEPIVVREPPALAPSTIERIEVRHLETVHRMEKVPAHPIVEESNVQVLPVAAVPAETTVQQVTAVAVGAHERAERETVTVEAKPIASEPAPGHATDEHAPPPPLVIEIDRIDIRIEPEPARPASARRESAPAHSLDEYLARQSAAAR